MRFGLLHVNDLVAAIICWLSTKNPVQGVYELDDGMPGGYDSQVCGVIAQEVWKRPYIASSFPRRLFRWSRPLISGRARLLCYSPMLTPGKVRELQHPDWVCDITPLTQALPGWRPSVQLRDALPQAI